MKFLYTFVIFSLLVTTAAYGACPNKCSGHGSCGVDDVCSCQQNWVNGDCSGRKCPYVRAWVDTAQYSNDAHYYSECANRGICDRKSGICKCDPGFGGSGCRRMLCPKGCNGHGTCEFIEEMADDFDDKRILGTTGNVYTGWDQEKIMGCKCDPGFEGYDCSNKVCPKGDDQLTSDQIDMVQYVATNGAQADFYLTYYDPYGNPWTTKTITGSAAAADTCVSIQAALRAIPNHALDDVVVAVTTSVSKLTRDANVDAASVGTGTGAVFDLSGLHACSIGFQRTVGNSGLQHLLKCHLTGSEIGSQPKIGTAVGSCVVGEHTTLTSAGTHKLTELATCSNRGICEGSSGECQCFAGHKGLACEYQEALV